MSFLKKCCLFPQSCLYLELFYELIFPCYLIVQEEKQKAKRERKEKRKEKRKNKDKNKEDKEGKREKKHKGHKHKNDEGKDRDSSRSTETIEQDINNAMNKEKDRLNGCDEKEADCKKVAERDRLENGEHNGIHLEHSGDLRDNLWEKEKSRDKERGMGKGKGTEISHIQKKRKEIETDGSSHGELFIYILLFFLIPMVFMARGTCFVCFSCMRCSVCYV